MLAFKGHGAMRRALRQCTYLLMAAMCATCGTPDTVVEFYLAEGYRFSSAERRVISDIAVSTAIEARRTLPSLPHGLVVRVYAGKNDDVIPETGETGSIVSPATVTWVVDPSRQGGVAAVVTNWLHASLLHEFHHLVRGQTITGTSLMDQVIAEGMATVYERDTAGVSPPWGVYPPDVGEWVDELTALPPEADNGYWIRARHLDGRRWIGMRAGTYLVDRATKASGRSAADLVSASTDEVIRMALVGAW